MIRNWTVITQPVKWQSKGLFLRERYLTSQSHPNHKNTTKIISLIGSADTVRKISLLGENFNLNRIIKKSRGRRLESYAMEFCLTLPKGYRPNEDEWKKVIYDICLQVRKHCKLTKVEFNNFLKCVRCVVHQQNENIKHGTGDHVHLIIPKVVFDGQIRVVTELQKKQFTKLIKHSYTTSVLKHLNYNINDYTPLELSRGKKLEVWKANKNFLSKESQESKKFIKISNQIKKWMMAFEKNDSKQINRQMNRLKKSYREFLNEEKNNVNRDIVYNSIQKIEQLSGKRIT
ncbi:hypothetical protein VXI18_003296 [Vibrio parahaemolyticus]|nr:hypothetical protein [Vibrio parahaemolyticus]